MSLNIEEQIEQLKNTIASMEAQRGALGIVVVEAALAPLLRRLDELTRQLETSQAAPADKPAQQQRKQVSILFMDIVGSTSIIQHMDPEDVGEIFDANLKRLAQPVEDYGGRVTSFAGDAFLAIFGTPTAREDDPERTVRAGLAILERAEGLAEELKKEWGIQDFKVRIGVNTGLVLLGGETEGEDTTKGPAVHLAARLQSAAPVGGMLVSHDTYRHIRGVFDVEAMEPLQVKGFDDPVQVYRILRARPRAFRMYTRGVEGVETRMVGRHDELKYLQDALLCAIEDSEGQVITILGDAGVGKSRLLYEFQDWIELLPPPAVRFYEGRGRQEAQGLPYGMLRDMFAFRFQIQDDDSGEAACEKIEQGFKETLGEDDNGQMRAHILGQWLGFDFSNSLHLKGVLNDHEQVRNRGLMYLGEYFSVLSSRSPVVVFLEDIHWADDSTLDVLNWLGQRVDRKRLFIVCAARPTLFERRPYWGEGLEFHHRINLEPLSKRESRQLVEQILKLVDEIPASLRELVVEGAEGNPFYVEELVKMLVEEGIILKGEETWHIEPDRLALIEVPPTLAGVLQARLDSLPLQERTVLQQASVVGRLFWDRIVTYIQSAGDGGEERVLDALNALRERELIYRREESTFAEAREYIFKHDILREVTYESVLKRLRRVYHGMIADWLIAQSAGRMVEYNGLIAEHLQQAGREEQACQFFVQAGEAALAAYANGEAEMNFSKALDLSPGISLRAASLAGLGDTLGREGLQEKAVETIHKAIDLYLEMGEHDRVATLYTRLSHILWIEDYQKAWEACQEGLERLAGMPDSPGMAYLLAEAGRTAHFRVQLMEKVVSLCTQAIAIADRLGIIEPKVDASITLALVEGDPQQGIEILQEAAKLSEAHGLQRIAARAHFNLSYFYGISMGGAERSYKHYLKSAEIQSQIGNVDGMFLSLANALLAKFRFGYLKSMDEFVIEFLHQSSASEAQVKNFLQLMHGFISFFTGDWTNALEFSRNRLEQMRKGGSLQFIANGNLSLVDDVLEIHKFAGQDHLAEAETALFENIAIRWEVNESRLKLAVISARKGLIQEAHERLAEAANTSAGQLTKYDEACLLQVKVELAKAERNWDEAISACQVLISIYQAGSYRWPLARLLIDLGDCYIGRNLAGDRERAEQAYRQSLDLFTEMEAPGYIMVLEERLGGLSKGSVV